MKANLIKILFLVLAAAPAMAQLGMNDLFNRPNSTNLGPDWTEQDGNGKILNNQLSGTGGFDLGWCSHNYFNGNYGYVVMRAKWAMNAPSGAVSLIAGLDPASWWGIEVRIGDNDGDGLADRIWFNASVNAGNWYGGSHFVNITPMASGEATMWFSNSGDTVNIAVRDLVTNAVQAFSASGINAGTPLGSQVGLGYRNQATLDDFRVWTGSPFGPVYTITNTLIGSSPTMLVTDATPFGSIVLGYSVTGAGPIYTPIGVVGLSEPIQIFLQANADASGRLEIPLGPLGGQAGAMIFTQAADLTAPALTNAFTVTLL